MTKAAVKDLVKSFYHYRQSTGFSAIAANQVSLDVKTFMAFYLCYGGRCAESSSISACLHSRDAPGVREALASGFMLLAFAAIRINGNDGIPRRRAR